MEELIPIVFFMCVTAVLLLRPITKRVGALLEVMTQQRMPQRSNDEQVTARTLALLDQVSRRLDAIDERLDFTERLVSARRPERTPRQFQRMRLEEDELEQTLPY